MRSSVRDARSGDCTGNRQRMAATAAKLAPMSTTAWSHHMAGDARPSLELRGVFLNEVSSRVPEIPPRNTRGVRRNMNKFIVILLRSR